MEPVGIHLDSVVDDAGLVRNQAHDASVIDAGPVGRVAPAGAGGIPRDESAVGALLVWVTAVTVAALAAPLAWRAEAVLRGTDPAASTDFKERTTWHRPAPAGS